MSGKMFSVQLEPIGSRRKHDPKVGLFSFNFTKGSSKKMNTSANSPESKRKVKRERSRSPHPSPGDRLRRIRPTTKSIFEIDGPIGSKRQKDFKAELFSFGFDASNRKRTSQSLSISQISSSTGTVESRTPANSGINAVKKRRSSRFKALSVFDSSDESQEEVNEVTNEDRDNLSTSPAKSRKLSNRKNIKKALKTNPINYSSDEVEESVKPSKAKKRGRPKKQSTSADDDNNHDESMDENNQEEASPKLPNKRGRPMKKSFNTNEHNLRESMDDNNQEENSPNQVDRRTRGIVVNGSDPQSGDDSDNDDDSVEKIQFVIEQARSDYMKLKNSELTNNVLIVPEDCTKTVAGFMSPEFTSSQSEEYPGVLGVQNSLSDSLGVGYMKIQGNTIRPPEMSKGGRMIFWILEGSIKVKSAGGYYSKRDSSGKVTNYLYGKKLDQGTCIVMPKMTPFTFENWDSADAVLGYCIMEEKMRDE